MIFGQKKEIVQVELTVTKREGKKEKGEPWSHKPHGTAIHIYTVFLRLVARPTRVSAQVLGLTGKPQAKRNVWPRNK